MNQHINDGVREDNREVTPPAIDPVVCPTNTNDDEDRKAARDFKFFALRTLTITLCAVVVGAVGSILYTYTRGERDFNEGVLNSVFSVIVEIVKLFI